MTTLISAAPHSVLPNQGKDILTMNSPGDKGKNFVPHLSLCLSPFISIVGLIKKDCKPKPPSVVISIPVNGEIFPNG